MGGVALVIVALVPGDGSTALSETFPWLHGTAAITFFTCLVYVAFVRSGDTLGLMPDEKDRIRFQAFYRVLAVAMALLVAGAALLAWLTESGRVVFVI